MKRRTFIMLLGGAAIAWPLAARAQQGERMRRIAVLMNLPADDPDGQARNAALLQGLQQFGWTVGSNVRIDIRWGGGDANRMRKEAEELVASAPDVILASGTTSLRPLLQATRTLPVVFANVADPVGAGFVASLAKPGGNATGFTAFEFGSAGKLHRARSGPGWGRPRSHAKRRDQPVRGDPGGGTIAESGGASSRPA